MSEVTSWTTLMRLVFTLLILFGSLLLKAGNPVIIGLFQGANHTRITVTVLSGLYAAYDENGLLFTMGPKEAADFSSTGEGMSCVFRGKTYSGHLRFHLDPEGPAEFRIQPAGKSNSYIYHHELLISEASGYLRIMNKMDVEDYVPGVVEAEAGAKHTTEYYKVQAIISRTYALNNLRRHESEGFHLCDGTHCQVYHGRPRHEPLIKAAVEDTRDIVIVDDNINLITAAFHSNCGGSTINAEDVWSKPLTYCVARKDTFCLVMPHSNWEKSIPLNQWTEYLESKRYPLTDSLTASALAYFPSAKQVYFVDEHFHIPLRTIREDLKLRSTFFTVHQDGDTVTFIGQGFGHGVGLCQEGAMRMAQLGYSYEEIIHYYYKDVHLVPRRFLWFFRNGSE